MNLWLDPAQEQAAEKNLDWLSLNRRETRRASGKWGSSARRPAFFDSMATMELRLVGYGLGGTNTASGRIHSGCMATGTAGQLAAPSRPLEVPRPCERVEVKLNCSFEVRRTLRAIPGRPSSPIGIPFDRPVVGYGGTIINTLRLWSAAAPDYFDFQVFSHGEFVGAVGRKRSRIPLRESCIPTTRRARGRDCASSRSIFHVGYPLADLVRRFQHLQLPSRWPTTRAFATRFATPSARPRCDLPIDSNRHRVRTADPDTIFDCQVKRIHEYKRQLLQCPCALW